MSEYDMVAEVEESARESDSPGPGTRETSEGGIPQGCHIESEADVTVVAGQRPSQVLCGRMGRRRWWAGGSGRRGL